MEQVYVNREWVQKSSATIPLNEAGFLRGDGVFETILLENGHFFRLDDHLDRLFEGLERIRISTRESRDNLKALLKEYVERNKCTHRIVRLVITRGVYESMPWEYQGPNSIYITHSDIPAVPESPVRVVFLDECQYPIIRMHPAVKSLNYLGNILAKLDAYEQGAFEPILYNSHGHITEGGIRNVFFVKNETLLTPPLHLGILSGTMRNAVIDMAEQEGIRCTERLISLKEVDAMDEAFLTSTAVKILPVWWESWSSTYATTRHLQELFTSFILNENSREE
ncbi:MAG TPA: aminotransferase class IV [bacterium]|nr:aminotransferase class IV [bacterium]